MPTCLVCDTPYEPSERPFGPAPAEPCACGSMISRSDAREMGEYAFWRICNEWAETKKADTKEAVR